MTRLVYISIARALVILCQIINIKLYATYLSASDLGVFFSLVTFSYMVSCIFFNPIDYYQQSKIVECIKKDNHINALFLLNKSLIVRYLLSVLLFSLVIFLLKKALFLYCLLGFFWALLLYLVQSTRNAINNLGHVWYFSASLVFEAVLKVLLFVGIIQFTSPNINILLFVSLLSLLVTFCILYIKLRVYMPDRPDFESDINNSEIWDVSFSLSVSSILNWIQAQSYRLVLLPLGYSDIVGVMGVVGGIGSSAMTAVSTIYAQTFTPKIYQSGGAYTSSYLRNGAFFFVAVFLIFIFFGKDIVTLLTTSTYRDYYYLLLFGCITEGVNLFMGALVVHLTIYQNTKKLVLPNIIGVLSLLVLGGFLILFDDVSAYTISAVLMISQLSVFFGVFMAYKQSKNLANITKKYNQCD